jgi:hypothetical protein
MNTNKILNSVTPNSNVFGYALEGLLDATKAKISRKEWSILLGVSEAAISQWVNGKTFPEQDKLQSMIKVYQKHHLDAEEQEAFNYFITTLELPMAKVWSKMPSRLEDKSLSDYVVSDLKNDTENSIKILFYDLKTELYNQLNRQIQLHIEHLTNILVKREKNAEEETLHDKILKRDALKLAFQKKDNRKLLSNYTESVKDFHVHCNKMFFDFCHDNNAFLPQENIKRQIKEVDKKWKEASVCQNNDAKTDFGNVVTTFENGFNLLDLRPIEVSRNVFISHAKNDCYVRVDETERYLKSLCQIQFEKPKVKTILGGFSQWTRQSSLYYEDRLNSRKKGISDLFIKKNQDVQFNNFDSILLGSSGRGYISQGLVKYSCDGCNQIFAEMSYDSKIGNCISTLHNEIPLAVGTLQSKNPLFNDLHFLGEAVVFKYSDPKYSLSPNSSYLLQADDLDRDCYVEILNVDKENMTISLANGEGLIVPISGKIKIENKALDSANSHSSINSIFDSHIQAEKSFFKLRQRNSYVIRSVEMNSIIVLIRKR